MTFIKRLSVALLALGIATIAAQAGDNNHLIGGLRPPTVPVTTIPGNTAETGDPFIPFDLPADAGITFGTSGSEHPVNISDLDDRPSLQTRMFETQVVLSCRIDTESGRSIIVANVGSDPVVAGTTIKWQMRGSGEGGLFSLNQELNMGQAVRARDVIGPQSENAGKCSAKAL